MQAPQTHRDAISQALIYTKTMQPQFSTITDDIIDGWTERVQHLPIPLDTYLEAAKRFQAQHSHGEWLTIGWLIVEAKKVADEWRRHPDYREAMLAYDAEQLAERDRMITEGTFLEARGYRPPAALGGSPERKPENVSPETKARWRDIVGKFKSGGVVE